MMPPKRLVQELSPPCSHGGWGSSQAAMQNPSEDNRNYENDDDYDRHHHHGCQEHRHSWTVFTSSDHHVSRRKRKFLYLSHHCLWCPKFEKYSDIHHGRHCHLIITRKFQGSETQGLCHFYRYQANWQDWYFEMTIPWKKTENCCRTSAVPWLTSIWKLRVQMLEPLQSAKL